MINLNTYISEVINFKLTRNYKKPYSYHPKDKDELMKILDKLIKERGYDGDFNDIDTSNITDMSMLFTFSRTKFNGDISRWNVSNVTNMKFMFCDTNFNGDISKWDVRNVKDMDFIFSGCPLQNNPPKWYKK